MAGKPEGGRSCTRGRLWQAVLNQTERAVQRGALQRIPTRIERVEQDGVAFLVHVVEALERKKRAGSKQAETGENPFQPYDEDLFVSHISDTHACLLNKYNVVEHHVLLITRRFEHQEKPLTVEDFAAMWTCMAEFDGLAFYNAGTIAGASQSHKHLQQVPLPLGNTPLGTPVDGMIGRAKAEGTLGRVPELPFRHSVAGVGWLSRLEPGHAAQATRELYLGMLGAVGRSHPPGPYNLLVTRQWMLLVPRTKEKYGSISVNALGFAGSLLVRDENELSFVRDRGPMTLLRNVAVAV